MSTLLHHRRHAWLYDLVVDEPVRGEGYGSTMLSFVEEWAEQRDCTAVALASPLSKTGVNEYYEGHDYERWGYVVEKRL